MTAADQIAEITAQFAERDINIRRMCAHQFRWINVGVISYFACQYCGYMP